MKQLVGIVALFCGIGMISITNFSSRQAKGEATLLVIVSVIVIYLLFSVCEKAYKWFIK